MLDLYETVSSRLYIASHRVKKECQMQGIFCFFF